MSERLVVVGPKSSWNWIDDDLNGKIELPGCKWKYLGEVARHDDFVNCRSVEAAEIFEQQRDQMSLPVADDRNGDSWAVNLRW